MYKQTLYFITKDIIPEKVLKLRNKKKSWAYGYNKEFDVIIISKTGEIGDIYSIQGLIIALPKEDNVENSEKWTRKEYPKELKTIKSIFDWKDLPDDFKSKWHKYIDGEFKKREEGYWFKNKGVSTYITGTHYMYLQWTKIDIGNPEFREANRLFFIFWEACKADKRCYGMCYLKNRRSGFSFMASAETVNLATISSDSRYGILSKSGADAKKMFTDKVVPISINYPFFFRPIQDGMDRPKTELAYRVPASKFTRKRFDSKDRPQEMEGLDTTIDWKNTGDNSYDGEKLSLLVHDEAGKWEKPENILNNWRVTKTTLRLGSRVIGKCMMGSTSNALDKGGENFKKLYNNSDVTQRNKNGQTQSGLYSLFIPMEWNFEGYIDEYGFPVFETPKKEIRDSHGDIIDTGVLDSWENEVEGLNNDPDALNEFYRQFPKTESHAFRDESKNTLFNLTKIYEQIDYNDSFAIKSTVTRGNFHWKGGQRDTEVIFSPENKGRFFLSWIPSKSLINNVIEKNGKKYPGNKHIGSFGGDSYDISGVVGGGGSKGSVHGMTKFHMDDAPTNMFFLEYISRPQTAEIFYEDVLMALHFYGMPILLENNKPRLLYYLKERGYRAFSLNRPDKHKNVLSKSERELGGIPSSTAVISVHAENIESYIEGYVGVLRDESNVDYGSCGNVFFNRTLLDWANYDITNRTKFDATVSSGFAIMANNSTRKSGEEKRNQINLNFARYSNKGFVSEIIRKI
jgi:hypothetical protein